MPPKRRSAYGDIDQDEKSRRAKMVKKMEPRSRKDLEYSSKLEADYKEPIKYDEYMEGGIPDSLLEGLGFTESDGVQESGAGEDDDDDASHETDAALVPEQIRGFDSTILSSQGLTDAVSTFVANQINAMTKGGMLAGILPQQYMDLTMASSNINLAMPQGQAALVMQAKKSNSSSNAPTRTSRRLLARNSTPTETILVESSRSPVKISTPSPFVRTPSRTVASLPVPSDIRPLVPPNSALKSLPKNTRMYNSTPRTVTKGNIVYERMPTGEVIASLIKKPTGDVAGRMNQGSVAESGSRGSNSSYRATQTSALMPINLEDCPINEYNVSDVLEKSLKATQSMRMLLTSLRDDLRRIGAGSAMVTEEQVRKRQEVADKLTKAYATYKRSIEDIESPQALENARAAAAAAGAGGIAQHAEKTHETVHPVMLIKHGVAFAPPAAAVEHAKTWRNAPTGATGGRTRPSQYRSEVIELSESDEDDKKVDEKAMNSEKTSNARVDAGNNQMANTSQSESGGRNQNSVERSVQESKVVEQHEVKVNTVDDCNTSSDHKVTACNGHNKNTDGKLTK